MESAEQRLLQLAGEAVELSRDEREQFLRELDDSDCDLVPRLRSLFREHDAGFSILDDPQLLTPLLSGEPRESSMIGPGTVLADRFEIERLLGVGGMGATYAAWDRELATRVALKVLATHARDVSAEARFRREIQLARQVTHPNVCRVYDFFWHRDQRLNVPFLTMEVIHGPTLAEYLREVGPLDTDTALPIARQIGAALDAAHGVGVVHRDLKPSNIMMEERPEGWRVVVTDFGLARWSDPERKHSGFVTKTGNVAGTPAYMAPEQLLNEPVSSASDVYALALVLYQMITGELPFDADSPLSMAMKRLNEPPRAPRSLIRDLDPRWNETILKALERDPSRRPESAGALVGALEGDETVAPYARRRLALGALVILLSLALLAFFVIRTVSIVEPEPGRSAPAAEAEPESVQRRSVLITSFDNRTGEPLLDGTLEFALARELERSPSISIVPRERVADTLRLMRRDEQAKLDSALGREVAVRDGAIESVISAEMAKLGSTYLMSVDLIEPRRGTTLASWNEEARTVDEILPAIRRIGRELRSRIGPRHIPADDERLAHVTTSSLRALQLYTEADRIVSGPRSGEAEELLRQAVAEDPGFASGFIHLAYAIKNGGGASGDYLPFVDRAVELSNQATERERMFIRASAFRLRGDFEKAAQVYRAMLSRYPEHPWALNNMVSILSSYTPNWSDAVDYTIRSAEIRPNDPAKNFHAARAIATWSEQPEAAEPFLMRVRWLLQENDQESSFAFISAWLDLYTLHKLWLKGETEELKKGLIERREKARTTGGRLGTIYAESTGSLFLALGRPDEAMDLFSMLPDREQKNYLLLTSMFTDRRGEARRILHELIDDPRDTDRVWLIAQSLRLGEIDAAERLYEQELSNLDQLHFDDRQIHETMLRAVEGLILSGKGNDEAAIPVLRWGMETLRPTGRYLYFIIASELARLLEEKGDAAAAVAVLEEAARQRHRTIEGTGRLYWIESQSQLAALQRRLGSSSAASLTDSLAHRTSAL